MNQPINRRSFLTLLASAALVPASAVRAAQSARAHRLSLGPPQAFDFNRLIERAKRMAAQTYRPPLEPVPEVVRKIDYRAHGAVRFNRDYALFARGAGQYPVTFFSLSANAPYPVRMHVLENGQARAIRYAPQYFNIPADNVSRKLPADAGFAGFRVQESKARSDWKTQDWAAFQGASYFRAIGSLGQYGLSARGVAVDTATGHAEEFPRFSEFYIQPALTADAPVVVYALLNGASITGAFRFDLQRDKGVIMDIEQWSFIRQGCHIERLGVAPLTSMYWFGELQGSCGQDWRPEVHDSDGLAMWAGSGERIWRPLNNPAQPITSSFSDSNPRGYGLSQRDRDFTHYLDGVHYERRPSLWVRPLHDWGCGQVQLVELPTDDEINDNIVAFWTPQKPATSGAEYHFRYRLYWQADNPHAPKDLARSVATRSGRGGRAGQVRPQGVRKFVISFAGAALVRLSGQAQPKAVVSSSRGSISNIVTQPVPGTPRWRIRFDLSVDGEQPVELRAFMQDGDAPLTETWLYQYLPGQAGCA